MDQDICESGVMNITIPEGVCTPLIRDISTHISSKTINYCIPMSTTYLGGEGIGIFLKGHNCFG